jgi:predicted phosphodiesterase
MRVAVISDTHGNLTALEAVIADLRRTAPDVVYHGGDLAINGARGAEVVDRIRELGWQGVVGNTDELLWRPELQDHLEGLAPALTPLIKAIFDDIAPYTRAALGQERVNWLQQLPAELHEGGLLLLHARPGELWQAPPPDAKDAELVDTYAREDVSLAVYGHIHQPYVRTIGPLTVANSGGAGMSYDGDPRASYLLIDEGIPAARRVEYDVDVEVRELAGRRHPHAGWITSILRTGRYAMPAAARD